uniref:Uncharacterized protein n=1 Tax=Ananas comosus var. bracteatus TaxID=296719 RepID=A0A6V7Q947_ANACO|nr:unnamed protein product [Ananas comosus var. bracteatus]
MATSTSTPTDEAASPHPGSYPQMIMDALATSTLDGAEAYPDPRSRSTSTRRVAAICPRRTTPRSGRTSPAWPPALGGPAAAPKPRDPLAPAKVSRPRGRPPKNGAASTEAAETAEDGAGAKRPRGRPPKVRPQFAEVGFV